MNTNYGKLPFIRIKTNAKKFTETVSFFGDGKLMSEKKCAYGAFLTQIINADCADIGYTAVAAKLYRAVYQKKLDMEFYNSSYFDTEDCNEFEYLYRYALKSRYWLLFNDYASKNLSVKWIREFRENMMFFTGNKILSIFLANNLIPFEEIELNVECVEKYNENCFMGENLISTEITKESFSCSVYSSCFPVLAAYVTQMKQNGFYLQRCGKCNEWFISKTKRLTQTCYQDKCRDSQKTTAKERFNERKKLFPHKKELNRSYHLHYQRTRVLKTETEEEFKLWKKLSNEKDRLVDLGELDEKEFIKWIYEMEDDGALRELVQIQDQKSENCDK